MLLRAFALLMAAVLLSCLATLYFGQEVLIALGLILSQAKVITKKLAHLEVPAVLAWLKTQGSVFFRIELLKKWITSTLLPLLIGRSALRRIATWLSGYRESIERRHARIMLWYRELPWFEKLLATLAILFTTLGISVTSIGLWLILFSVKLPLWIAALAISIGRSIWLGIQKSVFKAIAFLQLTLAWKGIRRLLPSSWLARKRRIDYRVARAIIRRRRLTVQQLSLRKDSLPFRTGLLLEFLFGTANR